MKRVIIHLMVLAISFTILYGLWRWTDAAFHPSLDEGDLTFEKPWRAPARLAFTATMAALLLGTQAYIAKRHR